MKDLAGRYAVVSGGGTGMGRELAVQLSKEGCHVAICDVSAPNMSETKRLCLEGAPAGTMVSTFLADVSNEGAVQAWAESVNRDFKTDHIHLLFNNAGIGGGGTIVNGDRAEWDRVFAIDWGGVYLGVRTFLPLLMKAKEGHIVNTSSVNGLWAMLGPNMPHSAYCAAKFAVRGFSEALQTDLRLNAPHIKCSVVMPGHIGTEIFENSNKVLGKALETRPLRKILTQLGGDVSDKSDEEVTQMMSNMFRDFAPTSAAQAASIIIEAVKAGRWRILVGKDAEIMDRLVRESPEEAYTLEFHAKVVKETGGLIGS